METCGTVLVEDDYNVFWDLYNDIQADCVDLLERKRSEWSRRGKKRVASKGGVQKRAVTKKGLQEKRTAALIRGLERMDMDADDEL
jgi:hypothetical protein